MMAHECRLTRCRFNNCHGLLNVIILTKPAINFKKIVYQVDEKIIMMNNKLYNNMRIIMMNRKLVIKIQNTKSKHCRLLIKFNLNQSSRKC